MFPMHVSHLVDDFPLPYLRGATGCVVKPNLCIAVDDEEIRFTSVNGAEQITEKFIWILAVGEVCRW